MFKGFAPLGESFVFSVLTKDANDQPENADALPTYRVYGPSGLVTNGTGSLALRQTGSITGATNASPIVITSAAHGLQNGMRVTISGVGGNTAANGTFTVANKATDTFELEGSTGNSAYTSGGTWNVSGLYSFTYTPSGGNGLAAGQSYDVLVSYEVNSTAYADLYRFTVV